MNEINWAAVNRADTSDRRESPRGRRLSDVLRALSVVADIGFQRASRGLSEMTGIPMEAKAAQVRRLPVASVPDLVGGAEAIVCASYLKISGQIEGHMLLILPLGDACKLASMLLGEPVPPNPELPEMARSALGEAGNITGSFFLAAMADAAGLELCPSPPAVVVDMGSAILDTVLADLSQESEDVFVIDTVFAQSERSVNAVFLVLPRPSYLYFILERLPK
ncbi:MAG: chemotaxis protein CheC [Sphingomonadaceae bacterium]